MTAKTQFQTLYAYHFHTTRLLVDCAEKLTEADYRANPGYGHGSIHDTLFHLLRTDMSWRRAEGRRPAVGLSHARGASGRI